MSWRTNVADDVRLLWLSARSLVGRWFWAVPLLPLLWLGYLYFALAVGWRQEAYRPDSAQVTLMSMPLAVLGILLGVRIIAGEIDRRTLEIAYTVPGGARRVWLSKFAAALLLLAAAEIVMIPAVYVFFTDFPPGAVLGALLAPAFYVALSMGLSALFKSEYTGALLGVAVFLVNGFLTGFGSAPTRFSPFWNPAVGVLTAYDPADVLAWTVQNRIGFLLATAALVALAIARAERREKMLSA